MLPDYRGGGIVNLMRSLGDACGAAPLPYAPLNALNPDELNAARHVVLLVIDGLGYNYLMRHGRGSALHEALRSRMTSVFPSTTATAITTFMSGVAPQQHALTGWHMYFEELERVAAVLPLTPRGGQAFDIEADSLPEQLFNHIPFCNRIARSAHIFSPQAIAHSPVSRYQAGRGALYPYKDLADLVDQLALAVRSAHAPGYFYAYYSTLDALAHQHGINSGAVATHFNAVDAAFDELQHKLRDSGAMLIATGDHGFIDAPDERLISLDNHPDLAATLAQPLCGERRAAYCYVRPALRAQFVSYLQDSLAHCLAVVESADLIAQGWFGLGPPHPKLARRVGDYTLLMKDNWTIKDSVPDEKSYRQIGVHGGTSEDEMWVPLIVTGP